MARNRKNAPRKSRRFWYCLRTRGHFIAKDVNFSQLSIPSHATALASLPVVSVGMSLASHPAYLIVLPTAPIQE